MSITCEISPKDSCFSNLIFRSRLPTLLPAIKMVELPVLKTVDNQSAVDLVLVNETLKGDLSAFDKLVRRYQGMVTKSLFRFCPQRSDLEDLVQETMIKAYRKLNTWKPSAPFEYWIRRIAINTGHDYFRRAARNPIAIAHKAGDANERVLNDFTDNKDPYTDYQYTERIQYLLAGLSPDDRTLLTLQYLEEMKLVDIADNLGWSLSKTKVKSHRARKKLKKLLTKHEIS